MDTTTCMPAEGLGRVAFEAYSKSVGGRTWDDEMIPPWADVTEAVRAGWSAAAVAILDALDGHTGPAAIRPRTAAGFARSGLLDPATARRAPPRATDPTPEASPDEDRATESDAATSARPGPSRRAKLHRAGAYIGKITIDGDLDTLEHDGHVYQRRAGKPGTYDEVSGEPEPVDPDAPTVPIDPASVEVTRHG